MEYKTRADLMQHPAFADLDTDSCGNPCIWQNCYESDGTHWSSNWSCQCEDEGVEPYESDWIGLRTRSSVNSGKACPSRRHTRSMPPSSTIRSRWGCRGSRRIKPRSPLRWLQRTPTGWLPVEITNIAAAGDVIPLSPEEIDALCERRKG